MALFSLKRLLRVSVETRGVSTQCVQGSWFGKETWTERGLEVEAELVDGEDASVRQRGREFEDEGLQMSHVMTWDPYRENRGSLCGKLKQKKEEDQLKTSSCEKWYGN